MSNISEHVNITSFSQNLYFLSTQLPRFQVSVMSNKDKERKEQEGEEGSENKETQIHTC